MGRKMEVQYIDTNLIEVPEVRITSAFDDDILEMFKDDIKKTGINQPLIVAKEGEKFWVIDGYHRLQEAKLNNIPQVPCVVTEMTWKQIQMRNLVLNRLRGRTKASEEVLVIKDLIEKRGASIDEIVEKTGMKRDRIEMLLQISTAAHEVWESLDAGRIKVCHAYQISRLLDRAAQIRMLRIVEQYRLNCDTLKDSVDEALRIIEEQKKEEVKEAPVGPPPVPTAECAICHQEYPVRDLASPIICRNCFATLITAYESARQEREMQREALRKRAEYVVKGETDAEQEV